MNPKLMVVGVASVVFAVAWLGFRLSHRKARFFFFDPQDCFNDGARDKRRLPASAKSATFEPFLKHYLAATQLIITVAAASIAFGSSTQSSAVAKLCLACSVFYGVVFCAVLLWRYDEYSQDAESYTLNWYSTVFAAGLSSLICFMTGYLVWAFSL